MTTPRPTIDPGRLERNWRAITVELDAPRPPLLERVLRFMGLPAHLTRLLAATPALRRAWFTATILAMVVGLAATDAARPRDSLFTLLLVAPLVPVLGVAMAYGPDADPAYEIALATPLRGLRLVVTRAVMVLAISAAAMGVTALLTPTVPAMAFAWLLPALGLTALAVATMTFTAPRRAVALVSSLWVVAVLIGRAGSRDALASFTLPGQIAVVTVGLVAAAVAYVRRDRFDRLGHAS